MEERTIQITVKLFGHFRRGRFKESVCGYPEGTTVKGALDSLQITDISSGIILVNGKAAIIEVVLHDGDTLTLFPLVSGG
ncbi:MAG: MoaD/ThiS family protein [Desulfuromonadaceae bacterium]|nr:MoaD/ThiS family protein [Desulfuromonadaceae bacterium]MDD5105103.1 MoaD/ThiS family protein [Desulfuromonadaceae bacterium]